MESMENFGLLWNKKNINKYIFFKRKLIKGLNIKVKKEKIKTTSFNKIKKWRKKTSIMVNIFGRALRAPLLEQKGLNVAGIRKNTRMWAILLVYKKFSTHNETIPSSYVSQFSFPSELLMSHYLVVIIKCAFYRYF